MAEDLSPWYVAREAMVDAVVSDLFGSENDDVLYEDPLQRFIVGVLHPSGDPSEIVDVRDTSEDDPGTSPDALADPGVSLAHIRQPATMGLTFAVVSAETKAVSVTISADRYEPVVAETLTGPGRAERRSATSSDANQLPPPNALHRRGNDDHRPWTRVGISQTLAIDVSRAGARNLVIADGLALRSVVRDPVDGVASITLALVNVRPRAARGRNATQCWFRPRLVVTAESGAFVDRRPSRQIRTMDSDEKSGELLYREQRHLAVGHGCAVSWDESPAVVRLETTFFPQHDLRIARPDRVDVADLGMRSLADSNSREPLTRLVDAYETWIDDQEGRVADLPGDHIPTARQHIAEARRAVDRMRTGIVLLDQDSQAGLAFRVMNSSMQEQRARQEMIRAGDATPPEAEFRWRPFQLAFILLNLEGMVDPSCRDRDVADLLWFPTGGGKTEAYLGLIAFTLVLRRLRGHPGAGGGVGVLMRYTLRLLTLQQFERASGLVCALERWRRYNLRESAPISIGLWLGQGATPNDVKTAASILRRSVPGETDEGNPRQLLQCPWCGADLPPDSYDADIRADKLTVKCSNALCEFRSGLPVHIVDSDVYRERPSLVIGTVDKFAMLAWHPRAGNLFSTDGTTDRPDLIIQDELHLISGPLGTLVGLYETAVDYLATGKARPKLIASTATIRRADAQVKAVFNRTTSQFPPPGIDASDSFFAVDSSPAERGTRQYVGVMAPGTSHATLLIRVYAALLQAGKSIDASDEVRDAYWTLLGYFNSLRVLGAAFIQAIDDVPDRINFIAGREAQQPRFLKPPRELTSRKRSTEIPGELAALQTRYPADASPDVVLATNMISVGVDVDRLGLMAIMGQPQTTAEYIQATSRVGRRYPGLVFALYNAARSRDLSHYESFTSYHRSLYRQVEPTGATPFAPRALDRGLHGVLVSIARSTIAGAAEDASVNIPVETDEIDRVRDVILARVEDIQPSASDYVREAVERLIEAWGFGVTDNGVRRYAGWRDPESALLKPAGGNPWGADNGSEGDTFPVDDPPWPTLTSLRNVDRESKLYLARARRSTRAQN